MPPVAPPVVRDSISTISPKTAEEASTRAAIEKQELFKKAELLVFMFLSLTV
jgi:hypothetical protein